MRRTRYGAWSWLGFVLLATPLASAPTARADVIMLRGGGEIQGKVVPDPANPKLVQVLLLKGSKPLTFQKAQIVQVIPRPSPLDEYVIRKAQTASTAEAEFELARWCEANRLRDLARAHYEAAVGRDRGFEPAHKKLGHVLHDGQWLSAEEVRRGQGLVKHRGKWITEQEKAKRDESAQAAATQAGWLRRIRLLRQAVLSASDDRRREAENELMQIDDPEAVGPLVKAFGKDPTPLRLLLVQALGQIEGKASTHALADVLLAEPGDEVRSAALDRLRDRDEAEVGPYLVQALRSRDLRVLNRGAWAIGQLGLVMAVPRLVGVLESVEERLILVPAEGEAAAAAPAGMPGAALMGMNQTYAAYLTGPAVGAGSVGFGAAAVPWIGNGPLPGGSFFGVGAAPSRGPQPRYVNYVYQNVEVRGALQKLTGEDFGYDGDAWRRWIKTSFNPRPDAVRRVPQP